MNPARARVFRFLLAITITIPLMLLFARTGTVRQTLLGLRYFPISFCLRGACRLPYRPESFQLRAFSLLLPAATTE
jgi:hypothetical protein